MPDDHSPARVVNRRELLDAFADAVRSSPHNLLSRRALEELEERHIGESLGFAALLPPGGTVLDLGTGGGFPGMVLAISRPDLEVTLLDATAKKVAFLREFADQHQVEVRTLTGRAEDVVTTHRGAFDVVTARAVAPLERLVGWALPFLAPGGLLFAIKGERWAEEVSAAQPALKRHRAQVVKVVDPQVATGGSLPTPRTVIIRAPGRARPGRPPAELVSAPDQESL